MYIYFQSIKHSSEIKITKLINRLPLIKYFKMNLNYGLKILTKSFLSFWNFAYLAYTKPNIYFNQSRVIIKEQTYEIRSLIKFLKCKNYLFTAIVVINSSQIHRTLESSRKSAGTNRVSLEQPKLPPSTGYPLYHLAAGTWQQT